MIDGRFWHDWFHEKVIAGTYNFVSKTVLDLRVDQQFIDAIANGLGNLTRALRPGCAACRMVLCVRMHWQCYSVWLLFLAIYCSNNVKGTNVQTGNLLTCDV